MELEIIEDANYRVDNAQVDKTMKLYINAEDIYFLKGNMLGITRNGVYNTFTLTEESCHEVANYMDEFVFDKDMVEDDEEEFEEGYDVGQKKKVKMTKEEIKQLDWSWNEPYR